VVKNEMAHRRDFFSPRSQETATMEDGEDDEEERRGGIKCM
jgi:hypothetical protein